jgi:hypothetical protein
LASCVLYVPSACSSLLCPAQGCQRTRAMIARLRPCHNTNLSLNGRSRIIRLFFKTRRLDIRSACRVRKAPTHRITHKAISWLTTTTFHRSRPWSRTLQLLLKSWIQARLPAPKLLSDAYTPHYPSASPFISSKSRPYSSLLAHIGSYP